MIKEVRGNVLLAKEDIICHQVNCLGIMGGGLALQIRQKYPEVYREYSEYCDQVGDHDLMLGTVLYAPTNDGKAIANLFGQANIGGGVQTDYIALEKCLKDVRAQGKSIAIPYMMSCGLAGGNWEIVSAMINNIFKDYEHDVTIYKFI